MNNIINTFPFAPGLVTETSDGLMSADDKIKLNNIQEGADDYTHPETHPASIIEQDENNRFVSDEQIAIWNNKANSVPIIPYYDTGLKSLFACGVPITIDKSKTEGSLTVTWVDNNGTKTIDIPENCAIFGGGYGEEEPLYYPSSNITINSGNIHSVYGGNKHRGNIGSVTIVINGGSYSSIHVGGKGFNNGDSDCIVGHGELIINNTDNDVIVYGGGHGLSVVGSSKVIVNGGSMRWLTAGGSNGHTSIGELTINDGNIKVLQGCNRGTMNNIKININGGIINNTYAGGESGDDTVTATYIKSEMYINNGTIINISAGTNGGVEDASKVSGVYMEGIITDEDAASMNLSKSTIPGNIAEKLITTAILEDKTLILKNGDIIITSVDLSPVVENVLDEIVSIGDTE